MDNQELKNIELRERLIELENNDQKADAQRQMTWFGLTGMIIYPLIIVLCTMFGLEKAANLIADIAPTYFGSIAVIVAAFFGAEAYKKK